MEIGLALPHYEYSFGLPGELDIRRMLSVATQAEGLGYSSVWISDHVWLDLAKYGGPATPFATTELVTALSALAVATKTVRIGSLVALEALRPASVLAKAFATLDQLSRGRAVLGLGAGWYEPDYREIGMEMPRPGVRIDRLAEAIAVVTGLFSSAPSQPVTAGGDYHHVDGCVLTPRPFEERSIPVLVGGKGDRVLDLAAQTHGWNTCWAWTPSAYAERLAVFEAACDRRGVDAQAKHRSLGLYTLIGESEQDLKLRWKLLQSSIPGVLGGVALEDWRTDKLVGTLESVQSQVEEWAALGVDELILGLGSVPFHLAQSDSLELASAVIA